MNKIFEKYKKTSEEQDLEYITIKNSYLEHQKKMLSDSALFSECIEYKRKYNPHTLKELFSIKETVNNSGIVTNFQPIMNTHTNKIELCEILYGHTDGNISLSKALSQINPESNDIFIENGSKMTIAHILNLTKKLREHPELRNIQFNINIDPRELKEGYLFNLFTLFEDKSDHPQYEEVLNILKNNLKFEILENKISIKDYPLVLLFIKKVEQYNIKVSIDDMDPTGDSNLSRLKHLQEVGLSIDTVKFDGPTVGAVLTMGNPDNDLDRRAFINKIERENMYAFKPFLKMIHSFCDDYNLSNYENSLRNAVKTEDLIIMLKDVKETFISFHSNIEESIKESKTKTLFEFIETPSELEIILSEFGSDYIQGEVVANKTSLENLNQEYIKEIENDYFNVLKDIQNPDRNLSYTELKKNK